jgi:DNA-binding NarL/FixJ family response regulator
VWLLCGVGVRCLVVMAKVGDQLITAQTELRRLAVAEERARLAQDLHDTLGASLTGVALRTAVAERMIIRDPARARTELHAVRTMANAALLDVRQVAHARLRTQFDEELSTAIDLLETAGVLVVCTIDEQPTGDRADVLALVLREAITNVLRHSDATVCTIATSGDLTLTVLDKPGVVHRALNVVGVHGFMLKADAAMGDLAEGIRRVHRGEFVCNRDLLTRSRTAAENPLTGRERDVVRLAARGLSAVSIAGHLGLAEGTVRNHVTRAKRKLSASTILELVRKAEPNGWL